MDSFINNNTFHIGNFQYVQKLNSCAGYINFCSSPPGSPTPLTNFLTLTRLPSDINPLNKENDVSHRTSSRSRIEYVTLSCSRVEATIETELSVKNAEINSNKDAETDWYEFLKSDITPSNENKIISDFEISAAGDISHISLSDRLKNKSNRRVRSFTCNIIPSMTEIPCDESFYREYDLQRHRKSKHSKQKKFYCHECIRINGNCAYEKTFSRLSSLSKHIKTRHVTSKNCRK